MLFSNLGLSAELLRAVEEQGYQEATPVQQLAIPAILAGRDILAGAHSACSPHLLTTGCGTFVGRHC